MERHRVFLLPGFMGFTELAGLRYFAGVEELLGRLLRERGLDAEVCAVAPPPTSALTMRAERLAEQIYARAPAGPIHLVGHSTGGIDARLMLSPALCGRCPEAASVTARTRTLVTVATPHRGTPLARLLAGPLGPPVLRVLSASSAALLGPLAGHRLALGSGLRSFLLEVAADQRLVRQLTPEAMETLDEVLELPPHVRACSVVAAAREATLDARRPGHAVFSALHGLSRSPEAEVASDGIVPLSSQAFGEVIHQTSADHLDVVGHFGSEESGDWLRSHSSFAEAEFEALWTAIAAAIASTTAEAGREAETPPADPQALAVRPPRWGTLVRLCLLLPLLATAGLHGLLRPHPLWLAATFAAAQLLALLALWWHEQRARAALDEPTARRSPP